MGKIDAFNINGLEIYFRSNDHPPPHFHVRRAGEWEIRVFIVSTSEAHLDYDVVWPKRLKGVTSKTRKELRKSVTQHKAALLEEWEEKVDY